MGLTKIDDRGLKTPIDLLDNEKIRLGTGNDLELYHDGNNGNSHIKESGSGSLVLNADDLYLQNAAGTENLAVFKEDGAVELYHNNSKKFHTYSDGCSVFGHLNLEDNDRLRLGDSSDLQIYHENTGNTYIQNATGNLRIDADALRLRSYTTGEDYLKADANGAVELYYDNTKKLETTANGVTVTGGVTTTGGSNFAGNLNFTSNGNGIRCSHTSETDTNDGTVAAGTFGSGLNIVGVQTGTGLGRQIRTWGDFFPSNNATEECGTATQRWAKVNTDKIFFNGDTAAANGLSDYEEGTWTPVPYLSYNPNSRSITLGTSSGSFTKIGRFVFLEYKFRWTAISGSGGYNVGVSNLPFSANNTVQATNGVGRSNMTGYTFVCENLYDTAIGVLRRYDNSSPNENEEIVGFASYFV